MSWPVKRPCMSSTVERHWLCSQLKRRLKELAFGEALVIDFEEALHDLACEEALYELACEDTLDLACEDALDFQCEEAHAMLACKEALELVSEDRSEER